VKEQKEVSQPTKKPRSLYGRPPPEVTGFAPSEMMDIVT
jgi:hypothetical protein